MHDVILQVRGLEVYYGSRLALGPVDFEIRQGERVAVIGANGAGKSTLLKALFGEATFSRGMVRIFGEDVRLGSAQVLSSRGCFYAPFGADAFPDLTVADNLRLFASRDGAQESGDISEAERVEKLLGVLTVLRPRLHVRAGRLSGGERRLLSVARARLQTPSMLLWDEPFSGLSRALLPQIQRLIAPAQEDAGMILAEQNIPLALEICTHALVLRQGRTVFYGCVSELPQDRHELFELLQGRSTE